MSCNSLSLFAGMKDAQLLSHCEQLWRDTEKRPRGDSAVSCDDAGDFLHMADVWDELRKRIGDDDAFPTKASTKQV